MCHLPILNSLIVIDAQLGGVPLSVAVGNLHALRQKARQLSAALEAEASQSLAGIS